MLQIETYRSQQRKSKLCFLWRIKILINTAGYLKPFFLGLRWINNQWKSNSVWYNTPQAALENSRAYLLRAEITKSHLNNRICQHCGVKTSTVTPPFYYVFNISLSCNINIPSFIGNLSWVLLPGNHLKTRTWNDKRHGHPYHCDA